MTIEIMIVAESETFKFATPLAIPIEIAQNMKIMSSGSFTADLNLTMDNAPTMPKDNTKFPLITMMIIVVINDAKTIDIAKLF